MKKLLTILFFVPLIGAAQKKDTVKVLLLVCDTSKVFYHSVYWQFGYEVREITDYLQVWENNGTRMKLLPEYKHIEYLSEDKSPMKKSVIIWQSKNR